MPEEKVTFQLRMEVPQKQIIEDEQYQVIYYLKNISGKSFPSFQIRLHLAYPIWTEGYKVIHNWSLDEIQNEEEIILKPKPIKAVAGPNACARAAMRVLVWAWVSLRSLTITWSQ